MWNLIHASAQGTSHQHSGQPCQDYCAAMTTSANESSVLLAACSDGAGSAEMADIGAKLAVDAFLEAASGDIIGGKVTSYTCDQQILRNWANAARDCVVQEAERRNLPPRQFACTLLTAVVWPDLAAFSQIGDGVIVIDDKGEYNHVFWPDNGEYANMTRFLTDFGHQEFLRLDIVARSVNELALITDGLQMLAVNRSARTVHSPFFKPMFATLHGTVSQGALKTVLGAFLNSDRVNQRTDDDKTLLLAARRHSQSHVPIDNTQVD